MVFGERLIIFVFGALQLNEDVQGIREHNLVILPLS